MNLFAETRTTLLWMAQILRQFLRIVPGVSLTVVFCLTLKRITSMLAFLLPLKVILLAGSGGVPRYLRPFIAPEHRETGIIVLSVAAVVCYALTLYLEGRAKRLSDAGAADLLDAAGVMSVVTNQRAEMQGIYVRFTQVVSSALFVAMGVLGFALLDPLLAGYVFAVILCSYLLTAWALRGVTVLKRNSLADFIERRLGDYLGVLSSVAFLSAFLVILYPFLTEAGGNILVAMICIMLLRQVTSALTGSVKNIVGLIQKRQLVETLVLPDRQFHQLEASDQRTLRELFGRQEREAMIADDLAGLRQPGDSVVVKWLDPPVRGMAEFAVALQDGEGPTRHFRQRVYPPRLRRMVENEDLLFRHLGREAVWAPALVGRRMHGEHECLVYEAGAGHAPSAATLAKCRRDFVAALWCAEPPAALFRIYRASHKVMHERLTDDLAARMDTAVDSDAEVETLARLRDALPAIRETLAGLPLRLVNPAAFTLRETVLARDGSILVLGGWGNWKLEPVGVGLPPSLAKAENIETVLAEMRARRPDSVGDKVSAGHVLLARRCELLEQAILQGALKSGLATAAQVLADAEAAEEVPARGPGGSIAVDAATS